MTATLPAASTALLERPAPDPLPDALVLRRGPVSGRWRRRSVAVPATLLAVMAAFAVVNIGLGDFPIAPLDVLGVLAGGGSDLDRLVVLELRLPRTVTAILVGVALGASGAITQSLARNPLASPDVLGITAGASAAVVGVIVLGGISALAAAPGATPLAALVGGLTAALAVYLLAWRRGVTGMRLVLVGIGLSAMLTAVTSWLLVAAELTDAARATLWLTGSLAAASWTVAAPLAVTVGIAGVVAAVATFTLGALRMGDDTARALGVRVETGRGTLALAAIALAAVAVAAAGPIAFVALVAPQVAMRLARSAGPPVITGAVTGAVLLLGADVVARLVLPAQLPVGIVTAVLGAPYLLYLIARRTREGGA